MIDALATAAIVAALAAAVLGFVATARDRPPGRVQYATLAVAGAIVAVQAVVAVIRLAGGAGPDGRAQVVTFIGYLITTVATAPIGIVLGKMEPTRYGSALVGAAGVVLAVLVVRLQQVWM